MARPERQGAIAARLGETTGPVAAIGALRAYGDAALVSGGAALLMTRLDRILAFDPASGVVEAEAGLSIRDLLAVTGPRGWMPPVVPGTGHATLGGCLAADAHGKNHHGAGSFGQHVRGFTLLDADGTGRDVRPGEPAFAATVGGMGLTGIVTRMTVQLVPAAPAMRVSERRMPGLGAFLAALAASSATYCVGWVDAVATGAALGRGILEEAEPAAGSFTPARGSARVPLDAPGMLLSPAVVRVFNALYLRRVPAGGRTRLVPTGRFLFPLDGLRDWNRLYGRRGFHQVQILVPPAGAERAIRAALAVAQDAGLASPLAVIKRMGAGRAGMLSFPSAGFTLALDLPARPGAAVAGAAIERAARDAGGRIYLAKDALAGPDAMAPMYPELAAFREAAAVLDPARRFATDLDRRLRLREG